MGLGNGADGRGCVRRQVRALCEREFADYHVPVNADVPDIEAIFIDKPDPIINPVGSKGLGEISLIGVAAAVANAVYNATGKRIRELPITPDKVLMV